MLNPMRNLGATLMQYYAWGSIWSLGYLVQPMLLAKFTDSEQLPIIKQLITELLQINLLLSILCLIVFSISRLKTHQWQIKKDTGNQLALFAIALIFSYFIFNHSQPNSLPIIYALISLVGIAQVSFSHPRTNDQNKQNNS